MIKYDKLYENNMKRGNRIGRKRFKLALIKFNILNDILKYNLNLF